jgi:hypothetical protein
MAPTRTIELLKLPLPPSVEILHPERSILLLGDGYSFDAGAFCYLTRSAPVGAKGLGRRPRSERSVDIPSLQASRLSPVRNLIRYLSDLLACGKRPVTVAFSAKHYGIFLTWAEANGHLMALDDKRVARVAFGHYVNYLREKVNTDRLRISSAAMMQFAVLAVLRDLLNVDDFHHGVNLLRDDHAGTESTRPPADEDQARVLALCDSLFRGLSTLCLQNRPYPYPLRVPEFLGAANDTLWVFAATRWCMPPHVLASRESLAHGYWANDYENGRIATVAEVAARYQDYHGGKAVEAAHSSMSAANKDSQHRCRRRAALLAHNAFIVLFLAHTGMNWSAVRQLPWSETYETGMERQGFRAIKYRAGGKTVSFEIQSVFFPTFTKYLELRTYLLNGATYDHLFMAAADNFARGISQLGEKGLDSIILSLRAIDPKVPQIRSRAWRAGKSDWLLRNVDPATAALIFQNSVPTVLRAYAEGSPTTQEEELGQFFEGLRGVVVGKGERLENALERSVGVCTSFGSPHQNVPAPIASDCRRVEGCLFCDKFKIHADERDTRKLLSCQYCIEQTAHLAESEEQFHRVFGPIFERIRGLLGEIERREPLVVESVEREVQAGELDPFWARKLEMLIDLDLTA